VRRRLHPTAAAAYDPNEIPLSDSEGEEEVGGGAGRGVGRARGGGAAHRGPYTRPSYMAAPAANYGPLK
jgi:hypothetical protein